MIAIHKIIHLNNPGAPLTVKITARHIGQSTTVLDICGHLTAFAEAALMEAYAVASAQDARAIILNFSGLRYLNCGGISLLVELLVRTNHRQQRLLACGLSAHYQELLKLTRLGDLIGVYAEEDQACAACFAAHTNVQESGVRSQESGVRSQTSMVSRQSSAVGGRWSVVGSR
jgi:anti-sigma B factor antagonist